MPTRTPPPAATQRVRICLSAMMRADWSAIVEVPADATQQELIELAEDFNRDIDGGEYLDDNEYWENNDPRVEDDVLPQEQPDYRAHRSEDGQLVWRQIGAPDEAADESASGPPYPADVAGLMDCICRGLTDETHGVAGAVIQSSDNDHKSGELFVDTPRGTYTIKVAC